MNLRPSNEPCSLAESLSIQIRIHNKLNYLEAPRVGITTVSPRVAVLVDQMLGAALDSLERAGSTGVRLHADISREERREERSLRLEVVADEMQMHIVIPLHLQMR